MKALVMLVLLGTAAAAQPDPATRPPDTVVVAGVDDAPRRGTWVEAALGVFTAMGGTRTFSSGQPYLAMSLGRDLGARASIFASLGLGAASASCYQRSPSGDSCLGADSFGATFTFPAYTRAAVSRSITTRGSITSRSESTRCSGRRLPGTPSGCRRWP
ncbi:MAG: hypothetical protein E6J86_05465 [Deltaproteobacteria bacterium]|nr:MAG: hypothetical protein E6J86_05465 [Deltaproteobacteria bacterium]